MLKEIRSLHFFFFLIGNIVTNFLPGKLWVNIRVPLRGDLRYFTLIMETKRQLLTATWDLRLNHFISVIPPLAKLCSLAFAMVPDLRDDLGEKASRCLSMLLLDNEREFKERLKSAAVWSKARRTRNGRSIYCQYVWWGCWKQHQCYNARGILFSLFSFVDWKHVTSI